MSTNRAFLLDPAGSWVDCPACDGVGGSDTTGECARCGGGGSVMENEITDLDSEAEEEGEDEMAKNDDTNTNENTEPEQVSPPPPADLPVDGADWEARFAEAIDREPEAVGYWVPRVYAERALKDVAGLRDIARLVSGGEEFT